MLYANNFSYRQPSASMHNILFTIEDESLLSRRKKVVTFKVAVELNMVASTVIDWEAKTGKSEFEANLDLIVRPCLKKFFKKCSCTINCEMQQCQQLD